MEKGKDITYWNIPVPRLLDQALEAAIKQNWQELKSLLSAREYNEMISRLEGRFRE